MFTNQISGKLVPVEPVDKSKTNEGNTDTLTLKGNSLKSYTISSKRQQTILFSWSKGGLGNNIPTSLRTSHHIGKPKESIVHVDSKSKPFLETYLPRKRVLSGPVDDDDDFA